MHITRLLATILTAASVFYASASDFFSTEKSEELITFGARIGVNTSNATVSDNVAQSYNVSGWGTGFDAGVVCNLNFRDYLSLQPGVYFQSRSNDYSYVFPVSGDSSYLTQLGHFRSYNLVIPVMGVVHFNITDRVRWNVGAGPYVSFCLGSDRTNRVTLASNQAAAYLPPFNQKPKGVDLGIKLGTSINVFDHYYFGIHYMAGLSGPWKDIRRENLKTICGGYNKAWTFTIGYDF